MRKEDSKRKEIRYKIFLSIFLGLSIGIIFFGCQRSKPIDIKPGEHTCEFCQMNIVDLRFKAEILTKKGKIHYFDSIECMMGWWVNHPDDVGSRWVSDFYKPEEWIPIEKAYILKSDKLSSPMGASLSAYASEEGIQKAQKEYGGEPLDSKKLEDYIRFKWKKEISKEPMPVH